MFPNIEASSSTALGCDANGVEGALPTTSREHEADIEAARVDDVAIVVDAIDRFS